MAKATVIRSEYELDLRLNRNEAGALFAVLRLVGGSEEKSPRGYTENILRALKAAGVCPIKHRLTAGIANEIYFDDDEE